MRDEYHIYGELVGHKIRSLSTDFAKLTAQQMINNILFDAQLGKYDYPSYPQYTPSQTGSQTPMACNSEPSSPAMYTTLEATNVNINNSSGTDTDVLQWAIKKSFGVQEADN